MFQRKNSAWMCLICGMLLLSNISAFGQSDTSSIIMENESVQRSIDSQIGDRSTRSNANDPSGLPAPGRPFNPPGVNAPQPSGFNPDRPTSLHSPNPSAFNPGSPSGINPSNPQQRIYFQLKLDLLSHNPLRRGRAHSRPRSCTRSIYMNRGSNP